jgi:hypothetical protein
MQPASFVTVSKLFRWLGDARKSARRAASSVVDQQPTFVSPARKNDIRARAETTIKKQKRLAILSAEGQKVPPTKAALSRYQTTPPDALNVKSSMT